MGHIQQRAFAGRLIVGDGSFVQVADVVQFVVDAEVGPAREALLLCIEQIGRAVALAMVRAV